MIEKLKEKVETFLFYLVHFFPIMKVSIFLLWIMILAIFFFVSCFPVPLYPSKGIISFSFRFTEVTSLLPFWLSIVI